MKVEIKVPEVGESITEGILVEWKKSNGDFVEVDEELFELETDKITMPVTAEEEGVLEIKVEADNTVQIGDVVGTIDTDAKEGEKDAGDEEKESSSAASEKEEEEPEEKPEKSEKTEKREEQEVPQSAGPPVSKPAGKAQAKEKLTQDYDLSKLSPAVRRMIDENNLNPNLITGTGKEGRITKKDVIQFLENPPEEKEEKEEKKSGDTKGPKKAKEPKKPPQPSDKSGREGDRVTRRTMSSLRQRVAERLVEVQQNAAILTTFNEVDMSRVMELRNRYKKSFDEKYGVRLGFMSFFVKAAVEALQTIPEVNAHIDGNEIVQNHYYDIGVAVSTEKGLVVPNVRDVDKKSFAEVELEIADLAKKARDRKLTLDDLQGGVFTISNGGVFGSLLSTPILNPPQSAILGLHGIKKRPMVVGDDDHIEVRPMMYLAMSYDHRIIDGRESVLFLKRIVEVIENPERLMLGI